MSDLISDEEAQKIIMALVNHRGDAGATGDEMERAVAWAHEVRVGGGMLDLVLHGLMWIDTNDDDELVFGLVR